MASTYVLVASQSSIQVLSPTVVHDVVVCTIQTQPSGVIASMYVSQDEWDKNAAPGLLSEFAANIETIMASPEVVGASAGQELDASGLLASTIAFVVGYKPPGSPFPPATVDVAVPSILLERQTNNTAGQSQAAVMALIDAAYQQLVAAAGGQPPTAAAGGSPSGTSAP